MGVFLALEHDLSFTPLNEAEAYWFVEMLYPYVYFANLLQVGTNLIVIPIIAFWYHANPTIFTQSGSEVWNWDTTVRQNSWIELYAKAEAINALLYLDLRFLWDPNHGLEISSISLARHFVANLVQVVTAPFLVAVMLAWAVVSAF